MKNTFNFNFTNANANKFAAKKFAGMCYGSNERSKTNSSYPWAVNKYGETAVSACG